MVANLSSDIKGEDLLVTIIPPLDTITISSLLFFLFMSELAVGLGKHTYSVWYIHKLYLTSKYLYLYNEESSSFIRHRSDHIPIKYVNLNTSKLINIPKNFGIIAWIYSFNPSLTTKYMTFSINIYWIIYMLYPTGFIVVAISFIIAGII